MQSIQKFFARFWQIGFIIAIVAGSVIFFEAVPFALVGSGAVVHADSASTTASSTSTSVPACYIEMRDMGASGVLGWSVANASSASIDHGIGPVPLSGTRAVASPTEVYTLTAVGQAGETVCRSTASSTTISVSSLPYTGFDFGPIGNALYWAGLIAISIAGAYLIVFWRGGLYAQMLRALRRFGLRR